MAKKQGSVTPVTPTEQPTMHNADGLIVAAEQARLGKTIPVEPPVVATEPVSQVDSAETQDKSNQDAIDLTQKEQAEQQPEESQESQEETINNEDAAKASAPDKDEANDDTGTDEYGNKIPKERLYTEAELNQIIRDRLKNRLKEQEQQPVQQQQPRQLDNTGAEEAADGTAWETQLEGFIENTLTKLADKQAQQNRHAKEQATQADFEIKFTQGMSKYPDFIPVVKDKPITDSMMLATRSMQDPAAFIYAACKTQPKEMARIADIADPIAQIAEVARLEERMKKARVATKAPAPATRVKGDTTAPAPSLDIDARINQYAKQKIMRYK